jgi:hypothetical protein
MRKKSAATSNEFAKKKKEQSRLFPSAAALRGEPSRAGRTDELFADDTQEEEKEQNNPEFQRRRGRMFSSGSNF